MNERVEKYLNFQKEQARKDQAAYRDKVLVAAGLYERQYVPKEESENTWDDSLIWDSQAQQYYKKVGIEVTDEEFCEIEKYTKEKQDSGESGMFSNVGQKIMGLATLVCWIGIIVSILTGIIMMAASESLVLVGLLTAVVGSLGSWIGSWFTYGFGELLETTKKIEKNTRKE